MIKNPSVLFLWDAHFHFHCSTSEIDCCSPFSDPEPTFQNAGSGSNKIFCSPKKFSLIIFPLGKENRYSRRARKWNTDILILQPPWLCYPDEIFVQYTCISQEEMLKIWGKSADYFAAESRMNGRHQSAGFTTEYWVWSSQHGRP